ncbi:hypothetical protein EVAR_35387_1 [Eumeta japonica]|uniref:Uncharacterized protein n=1 Tax=Eumeta variegata TaxID=151549 RepID=A0A4C1XEU3_EUMVA|nr:hypothetical protein EVAR_35387_1 [Eumeta japonica]
MRIWCGQGQQWRTPFVRESRLRGEEGDYACAVTLIQPMPPRGVSTSCADGGADSNRFLIVFGRNEFLCRRGPRPLFSRYPMLLAN